MLQAKSLALSSTHLNDVIALSFNEGSSRRPEEVKAVRKQSCIPSGQGRLWQMLRHAYFYIKGGEQTYAAPANPIGQHDETGHSGSRSIFFDVQTQLTAAVSPL